jgi:hypothetical protein
MLRNPLIFIDSKLPKLANHRVARSRNSRADAHAQVDQGLDRLGQRGVPEMALFLRLFARR